MASSVDVLAADVGAPIDYEQFGADPDLIVPEQLLETREYRPAERLLRAMLEDAFGRLRVGNFAGREALIWFESDREGWGSLLFVCHELDMDPGAVRRLARAIFERCVTFTRIHRVSGRRNAVRGRATG